LTSWNAMYIDSLFEADYNKQALQLLDTLVEKLYINQKLYHQRLIQKSPKVEALFEDYSFLISALLKAYDYSLDEKYLTLAKTLNKEALDKFYKDGDWYMSNDAFQSEASTYDSSYKSSLSVMLDNLLKLAALTEDLGLQKIVHNSLENNSVTLSSSPSNSAWLTRAYMAYEKGFVVVKATKDKLVNKEILNYPFVVKKATSDTKYQACSINACFAYSDKFEEIVQKIEEFKR